MIETTSVLTVIIGILDLIAIISVLAGASTPGRKLLWVLVILLLPVIGMILYFLLGRSPVDA
ncbi:MAG: PLDc N-terminal domain-containing protein [Gammaproteobacteria bacterium]